MAVRKIEGKSFGWKEKFGDFQAPQLGNKIIMFHGVSVGEVIALENLIKKQKRLFLTTKSLLLPEQKQDKRLLIKNTKMLQIL